MKESYTEGPASHGGPESCAGIRENEGEALTGVHMGGIEPRKQVQSGCRRRCPVRKATRKCSEWREHKRPCAVGDLQHV